MYCLDCATEENECPTCSLDKEAEGGATDYAACLCELQGAEDRMREFRQTRARESGEDANQAMAKLWISADEVTRAFDASVNDNIAMECVDHEGSGHEDSQVDRRAHREACYLRRDLP